MNKQQLATKIWESANKMRSKIEANEYKDYILGFIFYKFLSDKEVKWCKANSYTDEDLTTLVEEDADTVNYVRDNVGYFIAYENLFDTWLEKGSELDVGNVRDALSAFSRLINNSYKRVFEGIFDTLQSGLSKLGDSSGAQTKAISDLIYLIKDIPMEGQKGYDVLGYIYEYLIGKFASNAGKKAGEFYTPHEVSLLMSELVAHHLRDREAIQIFDPTSGSGSLLINIGQCVAKHMTKADNIKYFAQELKENTYNLTRMNLIMRGILPSNIKTRNADTLADDWPYFDDADPQGTYEPLYVDAVVSNPPYSQNWDPTNKENDPRYAAFGVAPKAKADYAFLLHDLYHLRPDGIMTIVLPHGVLFRGGEEGEIRKNLIERNHIDAIIGLPTNIFFGTGIPTIIMVLKQKRENTDVLIIDASKGFAKEGKNNVLRACDIKRITDTFVDRLDCEKYSRKVSLDEIRQNDYNLNIPRYVDASEAAESWDIYASMFGGIPNTEISLLDSYWKEFPNLRSDLFTAANEAYSTIQSEDIRQTISNHSDILAFTEKFKEAFGSLQTQLETRLTGSYEQILDIDINKEETVLADDIFARLENLSLIDKYETYQLLHDAWEKISGDLEILQTDGVSVAKQANPLMELKKKNNKDVEVQVGWTGHVIPFSIIQEVFLQTELGALQENKAQLENIASQYDEYIESFSEEEKDSYKDCFNEEGTSFASGIKKSVKSFNKNSLNEHEKILLEVVSLMAKETALKSKIKKDETTLIENTIKKLNSLTDEEVLQLLRIKWIHPLIKDIFALPSKLIDSLATKLKELSDKYAITFENIENEIASTEQELSAMIDDLIGNEFDMAGLKELKKLLGGE